MNRPLGAAEIVEALGLVPHPEGGRFRGVWRHAPRAVTTHRLGLDAGAGERHQVVVPPGAWQSGRSLGAWTLAGPVMPAFVFSGFELAPPGWQPGGSTRGPLESA